MSTSSFIRWSGIAVIIAAIADLTSGYGAQLCEKSG